MSELPMVCHREMEATMKIALPMTSAGGWVGHRLAAQRPV